MVKVMELIQVVQRSFWDFKMVQSIKICIFKQNLSCSMKNALWWSPRGGPQTNREITMGSRSETTRSGWDRGSETSESWLSYAYILKLEEAGFSY